MDLLLSKQHTGDNNCLELDLVNEQQEAHEALEHSDGISLAVIIDDADNREEQSEFILQIFSDSISPLDEKLSFLDILCDFEDRLLLDRDLINDPINGSVLRSFLS